MKENTLLEELMRQADETKALVTENAKIILGKTVKQVIKEDLTKDHYGDDESETTELPIGGDFTEVDADAEGVDGTADVAFEGEPETDEGTGDEVFEGEPETDEGTDSTDGEGESEEEEIDMTDSPYEDVLKAVQALEDGDKVVIVKDPATFTIDTVEADEDEDEDEKIEESAMESIVDDEETSEYVAEQVNESKIIQEKNKKISLYEAKILEMKKGLSLLLAENKKIKAEQVQTVQTVEKTRQLLEDVSLTNVNLMHITRLFTEQSISQEDKESILKEFETKVTTPNESKFLFESWERVLDTKQAIKPNNPLVGKKNLNEAVITEKRDKINESKSFEKPKTTFQRLLEHRI